MTSMHEDIIDGTTIAAPRTTISLEELAMILSTGYGIRCPGCLQLASEQRENGCFGDSLAVPFGFPYIIRDLEREGRIQRLDPLGELAMSGAFRRPDQGRNETVNNILRESILEEEGSGPAISSLREHLDRYTNEEHDIICDRFMSGVLRFLETAIFLSRGRDVALVLVKTNSVDKSHREGYGGIGRVGKRSIPKEKIWKEILVFPKDENNSADHWIPYAMPGLLTMYQHLSEHQRGAET